MGSVLAWIVGTIIAFGTISIIATWLLGSPFNKTADDEARAAVSEMLAKGTLVDYVKANDVAAAQLIKDMLIGNTGNDDEDAILAILKAAQATSCALVKIIIRQVGNGSEEDGRKRLKRDLQGSQDDELDDIIAACNVA